MAGIVTGEAAVSNAILSDVAATATALATDADTVIVVVSRAPDTDAVVTAAAGVTARGCERSGGLLRVRIAASPLVRDTGALQLARVAFVSGAFVLELLPSHGLFRGKSRTSFGSGVSSTR